MRSTTIVTRLTEHDDVAKSLLWGAPDRNTVDRTRWRRKITALRSPAPRSCIEPRVQVLHWAPHLLGPALMLSLNIYVSLALFSQLSVFLTLAVPKKLSSAHIGCFCSAITRQQMELESSSNPLKMRSLLISVQKTWKVLDFLSMTS